jgi:hypothetical protein
MAKPHLSKGEVKFPKTLKTKVSNLNLHWKNINYLELVTFKKPFDKNQVEYKMIKSIFKSNTKLYSASDKRKILYLCNLLSKRKNYNLRVSGFGFEQFWVVIFLNKRGRMFAIESKKELKEMLGRIDNSSKLFLWLNAIGESDGAYSFKKIERLWRVRFSFRDLNGCRYYEGFKYYNQNGDLIKSKTLKSIKLKKRCEEILM